MSARKAFPRILLALVIASAATVLVIYRERIDPVSIEAIIAGLGPWAPVAHILLFTVATVFFVPGAILGLAGGVLFGPLWGTIFNLIGATLGATASFLVARFLHGVDQHRRAALAVVLKSLVVAVKKELAAGQEA